LRERIGAAWDFVVETAQAVPDLVILTAAVVLFALLVYAFGSPS